MSAGKNKNSSTLYSKFKQTMGLRRGEQGGRGSVDYGFGLDSHSVGSDEYVQLPEISFVEPLTSTPRFTRDGDRRVRFRNNDFNEDITQVPQTSSGGGVYSSESVDNDLLQNLVHNAGNDSTLLGDIKKIREQLSQSKDRLMSISPNRPRRSFESSNRVPSAPNLSDFSDNYDIDGRMLDMTKGKKDKDFQGQDSIDIANLSRLLGKLSTMSQQDRDDRGNDLIHQTFLKSQRPSLPKFLPKDCLSWYDVLEKRLSDFGIVDPHQKYQLTVGLFDADQQIKLAPYMSKGGKHEHYDHLIKGVKKLFAPDELEIASKAESIKFDGTDLPSTFANRVKTILISGKIPYHDQHIKNMILNKFPAYLVDQLMHHKEKSLDDLMELADSFFITGRAIRNRSESDLKNGKDQDQKFTSMDLAVLTMLTKIEDSLKTRDIQKDSSVNAVSNMANCNSVTPNTVRTNQDQFRIQQRDFKPVGNSVICKNHQVFGNRSNACSQKGCKWTSTYLCAKHGQFGGRAWSCTEPNRCQYEEQVKRSLNC